MRFTGIIYLRTLEAKKCCRRFFSKARAQKTSQEENANKRSLSLSLSQLQGPPIDRHKHGSHKMSSTVNPESLGTQPQTHKSPTLKPKSPYFIGNLCQSLIGQRLPPLKKLNTPRGLGFSTSSTLNLKGLRVHNPNGSTLNTKPCTRGPDTCSPQQRLRRDLATVEGPSGGF